mmetsp:Transcript_103263/g.277390  ORF Transcript_103263/g.277390 Transcript_103263/m.277390 type:complete len:358 (-) Transcript_103263:184-1257(-)
MELLTSRPRRGPKNLTEQLNQVIARGRECESKALLTPIELHVVLAHEDVPEDPQGHADIDGLDAQDAEPPHFLDDKILHRKRKRLASEVEGEVWKPRGAAHQEEALDDLCPHHRHQGVHLVLRPCKQGSSGVHDGHARGRQREDVPEFDAVEAHSPPSWKHHIDPREVASDVRRVDASEDQFAWRVVAEVEAEDWPLQLSRRHKRAHQRLARGLSDGVEPETKDAIIGRAIPPVDAARVADQSKGEVRQHQLSNGDRVLAEHAAHVSGSIPDVKRLVQGVVRRGAVAVEVEPLALGTACDRDPEVRRACVEDDGHGLARSAHVDLSVVGRVVLVFQEHILRRGRCVEPCRAEPRLRA